MKYLNRMLFCGVIFFASNILFASSIERLAPLLSEQLKEVKVSSESELIYSVGKIYLDKDYHWVSDRYYSIALNDTDAARDYGRISIGFNHYYQDMELVFANVLTPNGELKSLQEDAFEERVGGSQDFYDDSSRLVFSLPEVKIGSVLEFQFRSKSKKLKVNNLFASMSGNYWYQPKVSGRSGRIDKVRYANFEINTPSSIELLQQTLGEHDPQFNKKSLNGRTTYLWKWTDLPKVAVETYMPWYENLMSRVRVSTSKDWGLVDQWVWNLNKDKFIIEDKNRELALSLAKLNATREQKIHAVYEYMQKNIRYVYAHVGRGGYEAHYPQEVIQQSYGDCKDQASLVVSLLKALGIEAFPALVVTPYADRPSLDLVDLYFDHMVVWIPEGINGEPLWLDTTGEQSKFPGVSSFLEGQPAFIVDGHGGRKTVVQNQDTKNQADVYMDYRLNKDGHLFMEMRVDFFGEFEQWFRNQWLHADDRKTAIERWLTSPFAAMSSDIEIDGSTYYEDSLWRSISVAAYFRFGKVLDNGQVKVSTSVSQLMHLLSDWNALVLPENRINNWSVRHPVKLKLFVTMTAENNFLSALTDSGFDEKNKDFYIKQSSKEIPKGYTFEIVFQRGILDLDKSQYASYYKGMKDIVSLGFWQVLFQQQKGFVSVDDLVGSGEGVNQDDILVIREKLNILEFKEAVNLAKNILSKDENNGEAWYLLGLGHGFLAETELSKDAFIRSRNLGYEP